MTEGVPLQQARPDGTALLLDVSVNIIDASDSDNPGLAPVACIAPVASDRQ